MSALSVPHPRRGVIHAIEKDESRYRHVVKHFYRWKERWDQVCDIDVRARVGALRASGYPELALDGRADPGWAFAAAPPSCREKVLADHQAHYAVGYLAALRAPQRWVAVILPKYGRRHLFAGDNGVWVSVEPLGTAAQDDKGYRVRTALRELPPRIRPEEATLDDFCERAVQLLDYASSPEHEDQEEGDAP